MKIIFAGTGSGKTLLSRFHSSILFESGDYRLLVDAGDGISKALLTLGIDVKSINSILISHMHPDHSAGLPSLLVQMKMNNREEDLTIYCHSGHRENLDALLKFTYILPQRLPYKINFICYTENITEGAGGGLKFTPAFNSHLDDLSTDLKPGQKAVSCSFLFNKEKNIFYTADIAEINDFYLFEEEKIDIMIAESTHVEISEIIKIFRERKIKKLYLTHIPEEFKNKNSNERDEIISVWDGYVIDL